MSKELPDAALVIAEAERWLSGEKISDADNVQYRLDTKRLEWYFSGRFRRIYGDTPADFYMQDMYQSMARDARGWFHDQDMDSLRWSAIIHKRNIDRQFEKALLSDPINPSVPESLQFDVLHWGGIVDVLEIACKIPGGIF